ncbi:hypothetical protein A3726_03025 [Erythrobacter sp. HI0037]|nr:hypothetical protein A3719_04780 [Erythrobacter sp. HI0020]KZY18605.1 hypothetical protein A3727_03200 [Erythrobacter sp. HI0038]KZY27990.1 hypothetical protein A3726_24740 [Erythrobacter sp. HI0037]KZY28921.1 hypothetical protein A3726_03025 [Erythrobacter sp. HI0037]
MTEIYSAIGEMVPFVDFVARSHPQTYSKRYFAIGYKWFRVLRWSSISAVEGRRWPLGGQETFIFSIQSFLIKDV